MKSDLLRTLAVSRADCVERERRHVADGNVSDAATERGYIAELDALAEALEAGELDDAYEAFETYAAAMLKAQKR